jgi:hypothetical protein
MLHTAFVFLDKSRLFVHFLVIDVSLNAKGIVTRKNNDENSNDIVTVFKFLYREGF